MVRRLAWPLLASVGLFAACVIGVEGAVGKQCVTAFDCPHELVCVAARPGEGRTCEVLALPEAGEVTAPDAGFAFYCDGAKPVLDAYCVSCHGLTSTEGAPDTFRLDTYASDGGEPAAFEMADRVYFRSVVSRDMPPLGSPRPSDEERAIIAAWFTSGARECGEPDAGVEDPDAGVDSGM